MASIYDELLQGLEGAPIRRIGERLGVSESQASRGIEASLPLLVQALANNARDPRGAESLERALERDHDGGVLDDLDGVAGGQYEEDGAGILRHTLGNRAQGAQDQIAQFAGLDGKTIGKLLVVLAPLVMGWLGRKKKGGGGLGDILRRGEADTQDRGGGGLGDILKDVLGRGAGGGGGGQSKLSGCMSLLGGLMGRKK